MTPDGAPNTSSMEKSLGSCESMHASNTSVSICFYLRITAWKSENETVRNQATRDHIILEYGLNSSFFTYSFFISEDIWVRSFSMLSSFASTDHSKNHFSFSMLCRQITDKIPHVRGFLHERSSSVLSVKRKISRKRVDRDSCRRRYRYLSCSLLDDIDPRRKRNVDVGIVRNRKRDCGSVRKRYHLVRIRFHQRVAGSCLSVEIRDYPHLRKTSLLRVVGICGIRYHKQVSSDRSGLCRGVVRKIE